MLLPEMFYNISSCWYFSISDVFNKILDQDRVSAKKLEAMLNLVKIQALLNHV